MTKYLDFTINVRCQAGSGAVNPIRDSLGEVVTTLIGASQYRGADQPAPTITIVGPVLVDDEQLDEAALTSKLVREAIDDRLADIAATVVTALDERDRDQQAAIEQQFADAMPPSED